MAGKCITCSFEWELLIRENAQKNAEEKEKKKERESGPDVRNHFVSQTQRNENG